MKTSDDNFSYSVDKFADLHILRYKVQGFDSLTLKQKELIYYLSEAALHGRDILFDQNGKYNLKIRRMLEAVYMGYDGDRTDTEFQALEVYLKRVWFSSGIHHHYSTDKFLPGFTVDFLLNAVMSLDKSMLPLSEGETVAGLCNKLFPVIFDPEIMPKRVNQADGEDLLLTSASNYYVGVTQQEAENFYSAMKSSEDETPVMYGMNSRLEKKNGEITEVVWKLDGEYGKAISKIVYWLEKAMCVAENPKQKEVIALLIEFYRTGDLKIFDEYSICWLKDTESRIDFVNGFIESYGDPLGMKASWESIVNFKDLEATHRTEVLSSNAQWFEDHSPVSSSFKKSEVKGVSAKVITAISSPRFHSIVTRSSSQRKPLSRELSSIASGTSTSMGAPASGFSGNVKSTSSKSTTVIAELMVIPLAVRVICFTPGSSHFAVISPLPLSETTVPPSSS